MRRTHNEWLSGCRAPESMKHWRDFANQFFGAPQNYLPRGVNALTLIDVHNYLSSIFTFKNPDVSTMYNILTNHFQSIKHVLFGVADIIKNSCSSYPISKDIPSTYLCQNCSCWPRKTHHGFSMGADPRIRKQHIHTQTLNVWYICLQIP